MKLSVCMITYNHEDYIIEALDGIFMQQFNFDYEVIISNDCSTDNTDKIINEYIINNNKGKYIKYYNHSKNIGVVRNSLFALSKCSGEYIAICEGDDYWITPRKLQIQVDYLDLNREYSMVCHNAFILFTHQQPLLFSKTSEDISITMDDVVSKWAIPTASIVLRREIIDKIPDWTLDIYSGDYTLILFSCHYGKIKFLSQIMSVYRVIYKGSSMSAKVKNNAKFVISQHILLLDNFNNETNRIYDHLISQRILTLKKELKFTSLKARNIFLSFIIMPLYFLKKTRIKLNNIFVKIK